MHCYCVYFRKINAQKIFKKRWKSQPLVTKLQKMMMKSNVDVRKLSSLMKQAFAGRRIEQQFLCCRAKLNHIMHLSTPFPQKQKWFIVTARRLPISLYILCAAQRIPIRIYFAHNSAISQSIYIATIFKLRSTTEQMPPLVFIHTQERCTATHCGFKPSLNMLKDLHNKLCMYVEYPVEIHDTQIQSHEQRPWMKFQTLKAIFKFSCRAYFAILPRDSICDGISGEILKKFWRSKKKFQDQISVEASFCIYYRHS
jgi:hypothetical protein